MEIIRQLPGTDEHVRIKLTGEEMREAYKEVQKQYEFEDIDGRMQDMDEDDLSGFAYEEIAADEALMDKIHERFERSKDCTLSYWDVMDESIRCVLEEKKKGVNR